MAKKDNNTAGVMNPPADIKEIYSAETLKELDKHYKAVKSALSGIDKSTEKITFNLYWIYDSATYKAMGCDSIADYASKNFDLGKSSTYSFIQIAERFGKRDDAGHILDCFYDKYKGFSSSKLSLLVDCTDEEIEKLGITPSMSVRDIKKAVKGLYVQAEIEEEETDSAGESEEDTAGDSEGDSEIITNTLIKCVGMEDYNSKIDKIDSLIVNLLKKHPDYTIEISYSGKKSEG
jgi:hypothetical protein